MRVEAHLHIRRFLRGESECISIRPLPDGKVHYAGTLSLTNVTFAVQQAGLEKFRTTGQKNVHAFVRGDLISETPNQTMPCHANWRQARYNPSNCDTFVDAQTGKAVSIAAAALLVGNKIFYLNP